MIVRYAAQIDLQHVFRRLAPERVAEMTATAWHADPLQTAWELTLLGARDRPDERRPELYALAPGEDALACAIVGVVPFGPGLAGMIWAAAPEWAREALASHRWWRKTFVPQVLGRFRRVEFTALAADLASRRWLAGLGFTEEGIAYRQGKRGEDFVHFAWINPDRSIGIAS